MPWYERCKKASINDLNHNFICDVKIESFHEEITIIFPEGFEDETLEKVYVTFYDKVRGLVTDLCRLYKYKHLENNMTAKCILQEEVNVVQRRNDLKIPQNTSVMIHTKDKEEGTVDIKVTIKDLSAGGVFIVLSDHSLKIGQTFTFTFDKTKMPISLECEVLRSQAYKGITAEGKKVTEGYGCKFKNLSERIESEIRSYVFKQDVLMRKATL